MCQFTEVQHRCNVNGKKCLIGIRFLIYPQEANWQAHKNKQRETGKKKFQPINELINVYWISGKNKYWIQIRILYGICLKSMIIKLFVFWVCVVSMIRIELKNHKNSLIINVNMVPLKRSKTKLAKILMTKIFVCCFTIAIKCSIRVKVCCCIHWTTGYTQVHVDER